jgi:hypothetical protein
VSLFRRLFGGGSSNGGGDAQVIEQLRQAGADLSQPRPVDHFLYFRSERSARHVVALLAGTGGTLELGQPMLGGRWSVQLTVPMVITLERITAMRAQLESLAADNGGEYDGWGAPVG